LIRISVDAGLHDVCWIERCPAIESLRAMPAFEPLAVTVRDRAKTIVAAIREAMT
jgi:hypothetical protein